MKVLALLLLFGPALLGEGAAMAQPAPHSLGSPVGGGCVSSPFGPRARIAVASTGTTASLDIPAGFHSGIDIPAPPGTPVRAVAYGHVVFAGIKGPSGGLTVDVEHLDYVTRYAHLAAVSPDIVAGRKLVGPDTVLGRVGMTGISTGPHLYFEMLVRGEAVDPARYIHVSACR